MGTLECQSPRTWITDEKVSCKHPVVHSAAIERCLTFLQDGDSTASRRARLGMELAPAVTGNFEESGERKKMQTCETNLREGRHRGQFPHQKVPAGGRERLDACGAETRLENAALVCELRSQPLVVACVRRT
jgi:hypothetical protein